MRTYGIERERFIVDSFGRIVPSIEVLLPKVHEIARKNNLPDNLFTYELFAGQIEDRTLHCSSLKELKKSMTLNDQVILEAGKNLNLCFDCCEMVEEDRVTCFKVSSFSLRHKKIWEAISSERKIAASVVAAVHVHISVDEKEIVDVLNLCREDVVNKLIYIGDHSNLKRINTYKIMAETEGIPPIFSSFSDLMKYINEKGGEKNVWDLVRYKPSTKTVEFRMFGSTESTEEIIGYVEACLDVIRF